MRTNYYPALDGLRGVAVLIVLIAHSTPIYRSGALGVDIFFVLSGFLITTILARELYDRGRVDIKAFYIRRFLRLLPALWITVVLVTLGLLIAGALRSENISEAFWALTYVINWVHALGLGDRYFLGHTWSLAMEEQFYLVWPFLLVFLHRLRLALRWHVLVLVCCAVLCVIYRNVLPFGPMRVYRGLDTHCDGLLIGSALAYAHLSGLSSFPEVLKLTRLVSLPALFVLALLPIKLGWDQPITILFGYVFVGVLVASVILDVVNRQDGLTARLLSAHWLRHIGKISYGLYLYHWPILVGVEKWLPNDQQWAARFLIWVVITILVSEVSYFTVEKRFLALKPSSRCKPAHMIEQRGTVNEMVS